MVTLTPRIALEQEAKEDGSLRTRTIARTNMEAGATAVEGWSDSRLGSSCGGKVCL